MAKPRHAPTIEDRKRVERYSAVGIPQTDIARLIGIDTKTLRLRYRDELDTASAKANAAIGGKLFTEAMAGNTALLIWWTKTRMRWSEKHDVNISGSLENKPSEAMEKTMARIEKS